MNKTLLLILCDFLLLTILSMWKMDQENPVSEETATSGQEEVGVSAMAMMEQDLLDTLQYSLEEEQAEREELAESMAAQAEELAKRQQEIEERESRIQNLERNLTDAELRERQLAAERAKLEEEASSLEAQVQETRNRVATVTTQLEETELQALQSQAQSRLLQEELNRKLSEIAEKEKALAQVSERLDTAQQQVQELGVQVRMAEQEKGFLQETVSTLKTEIVAERSERERLQEQAGVLAQGVSELAASSQDLRQELRSNFEINANQLFSEFKDNQITARFTAVKYSRNRYVETEQTASTVLVTDGENYYAVTHIDNLPFGLRTNPTLVRSVRFALERHGDRVPAQTLKFLALDPRIVAIPLTPEDAETLGGKPYLTALNPFKFPEAVLVERQGQRYGEVDFKLDAETPGFVKMQTQIFSAIFGDFSPSTGDLVISKTGELLGIMVNRRYCALVNNFVSAGTLEASGVLDPEALKRLLATLNNTLDSFPDPLQ